jgi:hypothetical protein
MKRITGLALIMFSLFSISYLVTSAIAQPPTGMAPASAHDMNPPAKFDDGLMGAPGAPGMGAPGMGAPGAVNSSRGACADFAQGTPPRESCERQQGGR